MDMVTLEIKYLITEKQIEYDEDGSYTYYEVLDSEPFDTIEILSDEDGDFDSKDILDMLFLDGSIYDKYSYLEADKYGLSFTVYNGNHRPLYEVVVI